MARIVSISYDETLLLTRELMLRGTGHEVVSCLGYSEAMRCVREPGDLAIIGHSIPKQDKLNMIAEFRRHNASGTVMALTRAGEARLNEVDVYVTPGDPEDLIRAIGRTLKPASRRSGKEAAATKRH